MKASSDWKTPLLITLWLLSACIVAVAALQEEPPAQPHTSDPAQCTRYCYPKGGPETRPKGTPEGIKGYECKGNVCGKINDPEAKEDGCNEGGGCTSYCAKVCCTCLAVCL